MKPAAEAAQAVSPTSSANVKPDSKEKVCPKRDSPMVMRTARQGANAGKPFYGCSTYPEYRGMVAVD